jgi:NADPH-dependent 7-cyano-7-deazaguanine reductase QueF
MVGTVPNEMRCLWIKERHILPVSGCCPISFNPQVGSEIEIEYEPAQSILEVATLRAYVDSFIGGKDGVRSMEGMIQQIAQDCANYVGTKVTVRAHLLIEPGQRMELECRAFPQRL